MKQHAAPPRACGKPYCMLAVGLVFAEVVIVAGYLAVAQRGATEERLSAALVNMSIALRAQTARAETLGIALQRTNAALEDLRAQHAFLPQAAAGPGHALPAAGAGAAAASPASPEPGPEPERGRITHAPWGECGGAPPRGAMQPNCRWYWEGVEHPHLIVEFGGNLGTDLRKFTELYPWARVHSFEPVRKYYEDLVTNFGNNTAQVRLHPVGASDKDATVSFRTDGDRAASSQFGTRGAMGQPTYETVTLRDVNPLLEDIVAAEGRAIDVLSINCEGCEYAILERLLAKGWLDRLQFLQVSWHSSDQIEGRVPRRCALKIELLRRLRPAYHADFGWEGWSASPRVYAADARFLGPAPPEEVGRSNGIPQAQSDLRCARPDEVPEGARKLDEVLDPESGHLTWPQTRVGDIVSAVLLGTSLAIRGPSPGDRAPPPLIVEAGAGAGTGDRFRSVLEHNAAARVHSFEPVLPLLRRLDAVGNLTRGGRVTWGLGLGAEARRARFRVWGIGGADGGPNPGWGGRVEQGQLWDADRALSEVERLEGRPPDMLYLNCEGCEYEVLLRLATTGRLGRLPRLVVSWHAAEGVWRQRCDVDARLRATHRLVRAAAGYELWTLPGVAVHDKVGGSDKLVSARQLAADE